MRKPTKATTATPTPGTARSAPIPLGARVRNTRTNEYATVVTRVDWCPAAATTLEYDGDDGQLWNTPNHKLELVIERDRKC